jgi:hypothetical protein
MTSLQDHTFVPRIALYNLMIHKEDWDFFLGNLIYLKILLYVQKLLITGGTNVSDRRSRLALRV